MAFWLFIEPPEDQKVGSGTDKQAEWRIYMYQKTPVQVIHFR